MNNSFIFSHEILRKHFEDALNNNYKIITLRDYLDYKKRNFSHKIIVNRIDIDLSIKKAEILTKIFNDLKIRASFFVRLHAPEYNPFSFENYRILKFIRDSGHEIGYHSEIIDEAVIWNENAENCLKRDINVLETMLDIKIYGVASHGGLTGLNNLDFWKDKKPSDFGLLYEAYDKNPEFNLFDNSLYVSDSNWTYWKCYDRGVLREGDNRSLGEHSHEGSPIIYSLIHSDTYYKKHFYE